LIKCPIKIVFTILANTKECKQNLNKNLKNKNHNKFFEEKQIKNEKKKLTQLSVELGI
jgi:hypothetical protein